MPNPRPIRDTYDLIKEIQKDLKDTIKPLCKYAVKGNKQFIDKLSRINWESLPFRDVLVIVLLTLSYGLTKEEQKQDFVSYIKKENMSSTSIFKLIRNRDGQKLKRRLQTGGFADIFKNLFENTDEAQNILKGIGKKIGKMKEKDLVAASYTQINALIDSIILGKDITP